MAWVWSAPEGVYKNHALSSNIRKEAIADVRFMRFLRPEQGYGRGRGESVTITRILRLPLAGRVSELDRLPVGTPAISTKSLQVSEWGFKLEMTEFEKNLTHFDLTNQYQRLLRDQMALTMDKMAADALKQTPVKYTPTSTGGVISTNGTPGDIADVNLSIADLRNIHDELHGTLKCPTFRGGKYVGILSTRAARGIKNDPEYKDWFAPSTSAPLQDGRLRDVENFALWETNHFDALMNAIGASGVCGEAIFFGDDPGFLATIQEPELRAGIPEDLGRFRQVGWVGTLEAGLTWEQPSLARVIHVTSQ